MTTYPKLPPVMGAAEVAAELGVKPNNLAKIANLPEPQQELIRGRIWLAAEIKDFAAVRRARS